MYDKTHYNKKKIKTKTKTKIKIKKKYIKSNYIQVLLKRSSPAELMIHLSIQTFIPFLVPP